MIGGISLGVMAAEQIRQNMNVSMETAKATSKARNVQEQCRQLEDRLDKLILLNMAMWELIKERTQITETDLEKRIAEIDLRDGKADGKISHTIKKCAKCGKIMSPRHKCCLYCGAENLDVKPFETI
ncbi:MAG TPA: hypothetical protein PKK48_09205 [Phycisphaerae bacterium]|nr:hypothetical protein [Phycisphaerae bacterium]